MTGRPQVHVEEFWYAGDVYYVYFVTPAAKSKKFAGCVKFFARFTLVRRVLSAVRGSHGPADAIRRFQQTL